MIDINHLTLGQKQSQQLNLVMTPALRQAIELLQYSTVDLYHYLKDAVLENPIIELEYAEGNHDAFHYEEHPIRSQYTRNTDDFLQRIPDTSSTTRDELLQLTKLQFTQKEKIQLITFLIHSLDDRGYLLLPQKHPLTNAQIEQGIQYLQKIGPAGLGARTVQECLLLQLQPIEESEHIQKIIRDHFFLLINRKWQELAKCMDLSLQEIKRACAVLQQLQLAPMNETYASDTDYVIPDIMIEAHKGKLIYHLHDRYLPKIRPNNEYLQLQQANDEVRQYVTEKMTQYHWLQTSIAKRRETIAKIIDYMLHAQEAFFTEGMRALKPLTLEDVAKAIGMHESTVSRATANKMIQTPLGIFAFKTLFTSKMEMVDGATISQQKVKALLQELIHNEDKQKPLSDQKIASSFTENEGIVISRRTISKYREELQIPSSRLRKEL